MSLTIRPMKLTEKPAIMAIVRNTPEFLPGEVIVAEEVLDCFLQNPTGSGYHVLVAEIGGSIVGYICYGPTPLTEATWDLYWAAVSQGYQSQGIGSALWAAAEDHIKKAKGRLILIETASKPEYDRTLRFHQRQGYKVVSRILDFYAIGDDRLTLEKRLPQG